jgi:glycosyltransferase involved in cell wall biosynthesis
MMKRVMIVGQTPPPYGGAAMMIQRTIDCDYGPLVQLFPIRLNFSKDMNDIGKFQYSKIFHAFNIVKKMFKYRYKYKIQTLYYFPAGPNIIPIIRDVIILGLTRKLFHNTIFHFRAAGLSNYLESLNPLLKIFLLKFYSTPEIGIRLSPHTPQDSRYIDAQKEFIVYNGIEDIAFDHFEPLMNVQNLKLLYIGIIKESKGISNLLEVCSILTKSNIDYHCTIIGKFESSGYEEYCYNFINNNQLSNNVSFPGVKIGEEKFTYINSCDIFLFPTYFESEGTPGAIIEAMAFAKPIIATTWRGVPSLVDHEYNGLLSPIKSPGEFAKNIKQLIMNPEIMNEYGKNSRKKYLSCFTMGAYEKKMKAIFENL